MKRTLTLVFVGLFGKTLEYRSNDWGLEHSEQVQREDQDKLVAYKT